eukprot:TRINITY_DN40075_c0_g1_i1.p1 TRINITY_DN40075_c0_g1~~TRINITY_DN40075_c0_g1_i1.p1  ORF type:complete len:1134 (-),score=232.67 TRINITY_DN40075_c0_g1_i1:84-3485(-)
MEGVGNLIISLHRNLQEIQTSIDAKGGSGESREAQLLQGTIDRAEGALRQQARELLAAAQAQGLTGSGPSGPSGLRSQSLHHSNSSSQSRRLPAQGYAGSGDLHPQPPHRSRSPAPPSWRDEHGNRAASMDSSMRQRPLRQPSGGRKSEAKTTGRGRILPKINRLDPLAPAPSLTEKDLSDGLLSLATRGFIPPSADLTPAMERGMPCFMHRPAQLYDQAMRHERRDIAPADNTAAVKLDTRPAMQSSSEDQGGFSPQVRASRQLPPLPKPPALSGATSATALPALPAPPSMDQPTSSQGQGFGGIAESYGTFFTELNHAAGDADAFGAEEAMNALVPCPHQLALQNEELRQEHAATILAAGWRGTGQRRRYAAMIKQHRAAKCIQSAWHATQIRIATKGELLRIQDDERKLQTKMMYELGQDWFQAKQLRRVEVHVCSLTVAESRRGRMSSYQALQCAQISRMFRLMDPKRDVILVAPKALHEDILDYYAKIMQFRGVKNPPGRFQVVVPENMGLAPNLSLTQGLLSSAKALKRIRKLTGGRVAYMVPEAVTHAELKLSSVLRLPLLGAGSRNMSLLASKSNGKKLTQIAELPTGPWAVDIYDEDEFFTSLAGLVVRYPEVKTWVFKIDDERDSRGHAYIDLSKMKEVGETIRASASYLGQGAGAGHGEGSAAALMGRGSGIEEDEPAVIGADASEVRATLQRYVPKKAMICNRRVYGDFAAWLSEACRVGAIIQAVPENVISQTSVHVQIDPDGGISINGTSEAMMAQPFVRAASWYPHTRGSFEVLQEVGLRMGRCLAGKGLVGFASVDVVFFENPNFDPEQLAQEQRDPSPAIIGSDTPINREDLMFGDLRSPSPDMSVADLRLRPPLPESRQADYDQALLLHEELEGPRRLDAVSLMLGGVGTGRQVGVSSSSPFGCWVVDIDARLTDEASALFPLQFIAQVKLDPSTGFFRLANEAPAPAPEPDAKSGSKKDLKEPEMSEEEKFARSQRWTLVNSVALAPMLEKMSYQTLFQAAKMRGVSFDLFHNVGCVFPFLDVVHQLFSVMCVERSPEQCAKRMSQAVGAIAEGPPNKGPAGIGAKPAQHKVAAPRDAPLPLGREEEANDTLSIADVQMALRVSLKRWADAKPK